MRDNVFFNETVSEDKVQTRLNRLRGLLAVFIVLGHCSMHFKKEVLPLLILHKSNMISVCFFFIVSGWGLSYNFQHRNNYLHGFLINKPVKLFLMALICESVSLVIKIFMGDIDRTNLYFFRNINWYIYEMIFYYMVFFVAYRYIENRHVRLCAILCASMLCSMFTVIMSNAYGEDNSFWPWTHAYHYSSLAFAWGIILHEYYPVFVALSSRNKRWITSILLLICGGAGCICLRMPPGSFVGGCLLHNLVGICLITFIAVWSIYLDFTRIWVLKYLTQYSAEIYLYQFMVLGLFKNIYIKHGHAIDYTYVFIVLLSTLAFAIVMHWVNRKIFGFIPGM